MPEKGVFGIGSVQNLDPAVEAMLDLVKASLDDDKAEDLVIVNLQGKTSIADYMIIASGRSQRHVGAIADNLSRRLKDGGYGAPRIEGAPACDWVLIDIGDIIVHLFRPEVRSFYNLEKMWSAELASAEQAVS